MVASAQLDELPLFVRAGAVIPMLPADVSTLSNFGAGRIVRLADRRDRLRLLAFPGPRRVARMFERERLVSSSARGRWRLAILGKRARRYTLEASTTGLRAASGGRFRTCAVSIAGRRLPRSAWRQEGGVLSATFRARHATLVARGC